VLDNILVDRVNEKMNLLDRKVVALTVVRDSPVGGIDWVVERVLVLTERERAKHLSGGFSDTIARRAAV
jgi:hypothetical protein